jgi:hypothetical protein
MFPKLRTGVFALNEVDQSLDAQMLRHVASANPQYGLAGDEAHSSAHGISPFSADQRGVPPRFADL